MLAFGTFILSIFIYKIIIQILKILNVLSLYIIFFFLKKKTKIFKILILINLTEFFQSLALFEKKYVIINEIACDML